MFSFELIVAGTKVNLVSTTNFSAERYFRYFCNQPYNNILNVTLSYEFLEIVLNDTYITTLYIPATMRDSADSPADFIRKYVAFFATFQDEKWFLVHGSGLVNEHNGVLLLGRSKAGKTTIGSRLDEYDVLDDDALLMHEDTLYPIGSIGMKQVSQEEGTKLLDFSDSCTATLGLKNYFYLTKAIQGGEFYPIDESVIYPWMIFPDFVCSREFLSIYFNKSPVKTSASGYIIGTNGNINLTLKTIRNLLCGGR